MVEMKSPEQQFDFWLGEWQVAWGDGQTGTNRVDKILNGKVIREQFDGNPAMPYEGLSLSVFDPQTREWGQTWVDNEGNYWTFSGGWQDGQMILSTEVFVEGEPIQLRMVFYNINVDDFEWRWERSDDGGVSWQQRWHITYSRLTGQ